MKLKTLKDLKLIELIGADRDVKQIIKAEAIKWVKPYDWGSFWKWCRKVKGFDYENKNIRIAFFIEAWIEYFFNITEEDLK